MNLLGARVIRNGPIICLFLVILIEIPNTGCNRHSPSPNGKMILHVAATGHEGFWGDGEPAKIAQMWVPDGIAVDAKGNVFVADTWNLRIRKIDAKGVITTVAGNGHVSRLQDGIPVGSYSGDGGLATEAALGNPSGITLDSKGNLYISDTFNHRIRKLSPNGIITTVAGTGKAGFDGDGGTATKARLFFPYDVKADAKGNLYIADTQNERIRKIDAKGIITTIAGTGQPGFDGDGDPALKAKLNIPISLDVDSKGNLYIADEQNHRIRRIGPNGIITTIAGSGPVGGDGGFSGDGGPATQARLKWPGGMADDGEGGLFFSDRGNHRIRYVDRRGIITTIAGNGRGQIWRLFHGYGDKAPALQASLAHPRGLFLDRKGNLYIADGGNDRIRMIPNAMR